MAKINFSARAQDRNDQAAAENRARFKGLRVFNLIGSPGCGKTALLERTASILKERLAVIVGDLKTDYDAQRIQKHGSEAIQIETGGGCHLNAEMVGSAFDRLAGKNHKILVIENVGNLVCPATYDLGEQEKVAALSLAEGDEKPAKYPTLFMRADVVLFTKIDLKPYLDFNLDRARTDCLKLNPAVKLFELSSKSGEGFDAWIKHLTGE